MFRIEDGRNEFYQWDLDRKLIIDDPTVTEVHFCNKTSDCSLVVEVHEGGIVNVPNILLQTDWTINAYAYCGDCYTKESAAFKVVRRTKPTDYIYTETELYTVEEMVDKALQEAIESGEISRGEDGKTPIIQLDKYALEDGRNATDVHFLYDINEGAVASFTVKDGFSPIIEASYMWDGDFGVHMIDITDANGERRLCTILDGKPGKDGKDYVLTEADKTEIAEIVAQGAIGDIDAALDALIIKQANVIGGIS